VIFIGVRSMPVLGAGRYMRYIALDSVRRPALAHLDPPAPLEEVERLLPAMDVPERPRAFLKGHSIGTELAGLVSGYALEICGAREIVGRSLLARNVISALEI
jgi:hypothetical protein